MSKLPRVKSRELIRALRRAGFIEKRQRGSHLHMYKGNKRVTVPVHKGRDIRTGTLRAILRDGGITVDEFLELLGK